MYIQVLTFLDFYPGPLWTRRGKLISNIVGRYHETVTQAKEWAERLIPPLQEGIRTAPQFRWLLVAEDWTEETVQGWGTEMPWETAIVVMMTLENAGLFAREGTLEGTSHEIRRFPRGDTSLMLRDHLFMRELDGLLAQRPASVQFPE